MKRVLILTAGFGEGHNTAARNLGEALRRTGRAEAEVADIFALTYGRLNEVARKAYLATINHAPQVWEKIYQLLDTKGSMEPNLIALRQMRPKLRELLGRFQPDLIASTYPFYSYLLEKIYAAGGHPRLPVVTVVTDSISINSVWYRCPSSFYVVPNEDTARIMAQAGVPAAAIRADGFPVSARLNVPVRRLPPGDEGGRKVLLMINFARRESTGLVEKIVALPGIDLTVTVGRDAELRAAVERVAERTGRPIEVHGWTDQLPDLMLSHHVLISKAGGATVQEAIAARLPMLAGQVVPGQEEGNVRLLLDHDCGALTETPDAICAKLRALFGNDAKLWHQWSDNLVALSRPGAADVTARFMLEEMEAAAPSPSADFTPQAYIFDIGNVLLHFDYEKALDRLRAHSGAEFTFETLAPLRDAYEDGRLTRAAFQERLIRALAYTGSEAELVRALEEIFTPNEPMLRLVEKLHGTVPLYLLSNTSDLHIDYIRRTYPVFRLFDDAVYSYRAGMSKPGGAIFELAIRQFGVDPARTIYIDDLAANVAGADAAGLRALQYFPDDHARFERELAGLGKSNQAAESSSVSFRVL